MKPKVSLDMSSSDADRHYALDRARRIGTQTAEADINYLCEQLGLPRIGPHRAAIESFREQIWEVAIETALEDVSAHQ